MSYYHILTTRGSVRPTSSLGRPSAYCFFYLLYEHLTVIGEARPRFFRPIAFFFIESRQRALGLSRGDWRKVRVVCVFLDAGSQFDGLSEETRVSKSLFCKIKLKFNENHILLEFSFIINYYKLGLRVADQGLDVLVKGKGRGLDGAFFIIGVFFC